MLLFASPQIRAGILQIEFGSSVGACNFVKYTQGKKRAAATPTLLNKYFGVGERLIPSKRITPMHSRTSLNFVIDRIT